MASRADGAARPITTPEQRATLQAELERHRRDGAARPITTPEQRATLQAELERHRRGGSDPLLWLQRQAVLLSEHADKHEFISLIRDACAKFGSQDVLPIQKKEERAYPPTGPLALVITVAAEAVGVARDEILTNQRTPMLCRARGLAMALYRARYNASYPELGKAFRKDHTTCIAAVRKAERGPWASLIEAERCRAPTSAVAKQETLGGRRQVA